MNNNMNQINSNWSYRRYMQQNANDIMKYNMMAAIGNSGNNPYILHNNYSGPNVPILFDNNPNSSNTNTNTSDLKQMYIHLEQQRSKMVSPYIPTNKS
jgi:hypothetical protein